MYCPNCGYKNRRGVSFCEQCGTALGAAAAPAQAPQLQAQPQQPAVVVIREDEKRRFNPALLLLLLLLLLITAGCLLMFFGQVETPGIVRPILGLACNQVRDVIPAMPCKPIPVIDDLDGITRTTADDGVAQGKTTGGDGGDKGVQDDQKKQDEDGGDGNKPVDCEEFGDVLKANGFPRIIYPVCSMTSNECLLDFLTDEKPGRMQIEYLWEGSTRTQAACEFQWNTFWQEYYAKCYFPLSSLVSSANYWIVWDNCKEYLGWSDPMISTTISLVQPGGECCTNTETGNVDYFRNPPGVGKLYLSFDLKCNEPWELSIGEYGEFDAFVGANTDIYWASGLCTNWEDNPYMLTCEAPLEDQKNSKTRIKMQYVNQQGETCEMDVYFQSPYYAPKDVKPDTPTCPDGQIPCDSSCCSVERLEP